MPMLKLLSEFFETYRSLLKYLNLLQGVFGPTAHWDFCLGFHLGFSLEPSFGGKSKVWLQIRSRSKLDHGG